MLPDHSRKWSWWQPAHVAGSRRSSRGSVACPSDDEQAETGTLAAIALAIATERRDERVSIDESFIGLETPASRA
jgi:hypothetical protein